MSVKALSKIGKSGPCLFLFRPSFLLALVAWLAVSIHHQVMQRSHIHTDASKKLQCAVILLFRRPIKTHCPNLAFSRLSVHVVRHVSLSILNVYHFSIPMSHLRFRWQRNVNARILSSALTCRDTLCDILQCCSCATHCTQGMLCWSHYEAICHLRIDCKIKRGRPCRQDVLSRAGSQRHLNRQSARSRYLCAII
jgi:hypothetical protein